MDRKQRAEMHAYADAMLKEARSADSDRIYSATGFSKQNISIVHQQLRSANLAWALAQRKVIRRGDIICIIGGSFSGLMLAAALAIANDVVVHVFERRDRLLDRFLDKGQRFLSPSLNSREFGGRFDPTFARPIFESPIFNWQEGVASDVAAEWLAEFEAYRRRLPIFVFLETEVARDSIEAKGQSVRFKGGRPGEVPASNFEADLLIDATGFGEEANPYDVIDYSYWEGGHRLIYDHAAAGSRILLSGCGDSGIVELLQYAIAGARHDAILSLRPPAGQLDMWIDQGLERAKRVVNSVETARYDDGRVISEVVWWLDHWWKIEHWTPAQIEETGFTAEEAAIFTTIEQMMRPHLARVRPGINLDRLPWNDREAFVLELPIGTQLAVRTAIREQVDDLISREVATLMESVQVEALLDLDALHAKSRNVLVTLNGVTPTPYTRALSPYNVWITRVLMTFPNVSYRRGRIRDVIATAGGRFRVAFDHGRSQTFDRVVTRYGPDRSHSPLRLGRRSDPNPGDWLLAMPRFNLPTQRPHVYQQVYPAFDRVKHRLQSVLKRRGNGKAEPLNKAIYQSRLKWGPQSVWDKDSRYADPQAWLKSELRCGRRPTYSDTGAPLQPLVPA